MPKRLTLLTASAAAVSLCATGCGGASTGKVATASSAKKRTVGSVQTTDFRAILVARKTSGGAAPTASVTVTTFERSGGHWKRLRSRRLGRTTGFFWNTVTGPRSVCRLAIAEAKGAPHVVVQLLLTPSIGCARAETIPLGKGS